MERALEALDHDPTRDRLFSVGDLIDYGTRSDDALEWNRSRFAAVVRGNHEQMMLDWLWGGARMHTDGGAWRGHWASWWFPMSRPRDQRLAWLKTLCRLPFAATVRKQSGARIALVHRYPVLALEEQHHRLDRGQADPLRLVLREHRDQLHRNRLTALPSRQQQLRFPAGRGRLRVQLGGGVVDVLEVMSIEGID